ncbi:MAG TPA: glycoside hydrolase family 25 protein [Reyranella sp.]
MAPQHYQPNPPAQYPPAEYPPAQYPIAPAPPSRATLGLDAIVDLSAHTTVSDFQLVRASNILAVIHKASEGDFYADPLCAERRSQAEAAGLLWGTYHYGKGDSPGAQQAAFFLETSRPGSGTLLALDFEPNEGDPSNSMTLEQAEAFVQAVASATGRLPLVYVHPTWANGRIAPDSILARCGLWVVDYHDSPEIPRAWARSGWRLWQYASDGYAGRRAHGRNRIIQGLDRCDRNLFNGDVAALYRFWNAAT